MKTLLVFWFSFFFIQVSFAQKLAVDYKTADSWPEIRSEGISGDGQYLVYVIYSKNAGSTLYIQAVNDRWKRAIKGVDHVVFSADSRYALFLASNDSLALLELKSNKLDMIAGVKSFQTSTKDGNSIAYQVDSGEMKLVLLNLSTGLKKSYHKALDYEFADNGSVLLIHTQDTLASGICQSLVWNDLDKGHTKIIWQGKKASNFSFDTSATQFSFIQEVSENHVSLNTIMYYQKGSDSARSLADLNSQVLNPNFVIANQKPEFSNDGRKLYFELQKKNG